jgi:hypothetical protein
MDPTDPEPETCKNIYSENRIYKIVPVLLVLFTLRMYNTKSGEVQ